MLSLLTFRKKDKQFPNISKTLLYTKIKETKIFKVYNFNTRILTFSVYSMIINSLCAHLQLN